MDVKTSEKQTDRAHFYVNKMANVVEENVEFFSDFDEFDDDFFDEIIERYEEENMLDDNSTDNVSFHILCLFLS